MYVYVTFNILNILFNYVISLSAINQIRKVNVVSLVGKFSKLFSALSEDLRIPYFITSPVPLLQSPSPYHIRMIPDVSMYTQAVRDLFQHYGWKSGGVLYNTQFGLYTIMLLLSLSKYSEFFFPILTNLKVFIITWVHVSSKNSKQDNFNSSCLIMGNKSCEF